PGAGQGNMRGRARAVRWVAGAVAATVAACGDNLAPPALVRPVAVRGVAPARGSLPGGTPIAIDGAGFATGPPPLVVLGRRRAVGVTVIDDDTLVTTTPPGERPGPVDITIVVGDQYDRLDRAFSYNSQPTIATIDPDSGDRAGGTPVTITGTGFLDPDAGAAAVRFGDVAATDVVIVSDTEITAT